MRFGQVNSLLSLILHSHSGWSMLVEEQAATTAPPGVVLLLLPAVSCLVAQKGVNIRSYAMVDGE